jgi:hypothetical protein
VRSQGLATLGFEKNAFGVQDLTPVSVPPVSVPKGLGKNAFGVQDFTPVFVENVVGGNIEIAVFCVQCSEKTTMSKPAVPR